MKRERKQSRQKQTETGNSSSWVKFCSSLKEHNLDECGFAHITEYRFLLGKISLQKRKVCDARVKGSRHKGRGT